MLKKAWAVRTRNLEARVGKQIGVFEEKRYRNAAVPENLVEM